MPISPLACGGSGEGGATGPARTKLTAESRSLVLPPLPAEVEVDRIPEPVGETEPLRAAMGLRLRGRANAAGNHERRTNSIGPSHSTPSTRSSSTKARGSATRFRQVPIRRSRFDASHPIPLRSHRIPLASASSAQSVARRSWEAGGVQVMNRPRCCTLGGGERATASWSLGKFVPHSDLRVSMPVQFRSEPYGARCI